MATQDGYVLSILHASHQHKKHSYTARLSLDLFLAVERIQSQQASEMQQYAYEQPPQTAKQQRNMVSGDRAKHQYEQRKIENQVSQGVEGGCSKCEARMRPVKSKQLD